MKTLDVHLLLKTFKEVEVLLGLQSSITPELDLLGLLDGWLSREELLHDCSCVSGSHAWSSAKKSKYLTSCFVTMTTPKRYS